MLAKTPRTVVITAEMVATAILVASELINPPSLNVAPP
jgi:hypothetical protein